MESLARMTITIEDETGATTTISGEEVRDVEIVVDDVLPPDGIDLMRETDAKRSWRVRASGEVIRGYRVEVGKVADEVESLRAAVVRVREEHPRSVVEPDWCAGCRESYPCRTVRALDGQA